MNLKSLRKAAVQKDDGVKVIKIVHNDEQGKNQQVRESEKQEREV